MIFLHSKANRTTKPLRFYPSTFYSIVNILPAFILSSKKCLKNVDHVKIFTAGRLKGYIWRHAGFFSKVATYA